MRTVIDLNCDLGEGMSADAALLDIVSSANIACGYHAGDENTMRRTVTQALQRGVIIGAHPGYLDREGFGRRHQPLEHRELIKLVHDQVDQLSEIAAALQGSVRHVRAHGALGNLTDEDYVAAQVLVEALSQKQLTLMTLGNSAAEQAALHAGVPVVRQFFADRAYNAQGQLVSRHIEGSVLHDHRLIVSRILQALDSGYIESLDGKRIATTFDTICVHGDTEGALQVAEHIRFTLEKNGIAIRPYTESLSP